MPSSYQTSSGRVRHRANWLDLEGRQHSKNFDTEAEAAAHERQMHEEKELARAGGVCALMGCGQPLPPHGGIGRRPIYHSPECARIARRDMTKRWKQANRQPAPQRPPRPCKFCGEPVTQNPVGRPRLYCPDTDCRAKAWTATMMQARSEKRGRDLHSLSEVDVDSMTAECAYCLNHHDMERVKVYALRQSDGKVRFVCSERVKTRNAERRAEDVSLDRLKRWRARGIKIEEGDFEFLFQEQGGVCAMPGCGRELTAPHLDHDHDTGEVRGLCCSRCNSGLGKHGDTVATLRARLAYLERQPPLRARHCAAGGAPRNGVDSPGIEPPCQEE